MQAFAVSLVLMSSACGQGAMSTVQSSPAPVFRVHRELSPAPCVVYLNADRYDSGKGDRHVLPLSGRCGATSGQR